MVEVAAAAEVMLVPLLVDRPRLWNRYPWRPFWPRQYWWLWQVLRVESRKDEDS